MVGAVLTDADLFGLGWRAVFAINIPAGLIVLAGMFVIPRTGHSASDTGHDSPPAGLDLGGVAWLAVGLALVVGPLLWGTDLGWPRWMVALGAAAVPALGAFALHQRRRARRGRSLLIDPALFGFRSLRGALLVTTLTFAAVFGLFFTLALHLQGDRGWTPMQAAV